MNSNFKRTLSLLLVLVMCISLVPASAWAEDEDLNLQTIETVEDDGTVTETSASDNQEVLPENGLGTEEYSKESSMVLTALSGPVSGTDGNISWTLDTNGVLTLSGSGAMKDYEIDGQNSAPWKGYSNVILSAVVNSGITSIGEYAFCSCGSLESVTIPNSVQSIGDGAFYWCTKLESVTIPNGVQSIGNKAFYWCTKLASITISDSVESIGDEAFRECTGLASIKIGSGVESIGESAFYNCKSLTSAAIPNGVKIIDKNLFHTCSSLESVAIPSSVESIGDYAFEGCAKLASVTFPDSLQSIGKGAFHACISLTKLTIPNSVESIDDVTFADCSSLESVTLPDSLQSIGNSMFVNCSSLASVKIPNSVKSIGDYAFGSCAKLTSVTIGNSVESIGEYAFYSCYDLTSVTIPNSVKSIGDSAFESCSGLAGITIGDSVESIGEQAFYFCYNLKSVTIPNSVTSIGESAFDSCSSLTDIYYNGTQEDWNKISIMTGNTELENATKHFKGDTTPSAPENVRWDPFGVVKFTVPDDIWADKNNYNYFISLEVNGNTYKSMSGSLRVKDFNLELYNWSEFRDYSGEFLVTVYFKSTNGGSDSQKVETAPYNHTVPTQKLGTPTAIAKKGTIISWTKVENASAYCLRFYDSDGYIKLENQVTSNYIDTSSGLYSNSSFASIEIFAVSFSPATVASGDSVEYQMSMLPEGDYVSEISIISQPKSCTVKEGGSATLSVKAEYSGEGKLSYLWKSYNIYTQQWEDANDFAAPYTNSTFTIKDVTMYLNDYLFKCIVSAPDGQKIETNEVTITVNSAGSQTLNYGYLLYKVENGGIKITDCNAAASGYLEIPMSINGYPVREIGDSAFRNCREITRISLPNGIRSIGSYAFSGCSGISSVSIPNNTSVIGESAFADCGSLSFVGFGSSAIKTIGKNAFKNCSALSYVYYAGAESQWKKISVGAGNERLLNADISYEKSSGYSFPVNLRWEPFGTVKFAVPDDVLAANAFYSLTLYINGELYSRDTGMTYRRELGQIYQKEMEVSLYEIEAFGKISGDYQIKVCFVNDGDWNDYPGAMTDVFEFKVPSNRLTTPENVLKYENYISWSPVDGADGYCYRIKDEYGRIIVVSRTDTNLVNLSSWYAQAEISGMPYTIEISAVSDSPLTIANSGFCASKVIDNLGTGYFEAATAVVNTYAELLKASKSDCINQRSIVIPKGTSITLENNFMLSDKTTLNVVGTLTVPSGVRFKVSENSSLLVYGKVETKKESTFSADGYIQIGGTSAYSGENPWSGNILVNGRCSMGNGAQIILAVKDSNKTNAVTNLPKDRCLIWYYTSVSNDDTLDNAAAYVKGYKNATIIDSGDADTAITLHRSHNLGKSVQLCLLPTGSASYELTLDTGKSLALGVLTLKPGAVRISFSEGSGLYLLHSPMRVSGGEWYSVPEGMTIEDFYFRNENGHINRVSSLEQFSTCLKNGISCEVPSGTDISIPAGSTAKIAAGTVLTNNGSIMISGNFKAESTASVINNGTITAMSNADCPFEIVEGNQVKISLLNRNVFKDAALLAKIREYAGGDCFTAEDAEKVTSLDISNLGIVYLDGLEYFKNLETLDCSKNYIRSLDISHFKKLETIDCSGNRISDINVGGNELLREFNCSDNLVREINLSACSELSQFSFESCSQLKSVYLPADITKICDRAFKGTAVETVTIPQGVESIGKEAYMNCTSLSSLSVPDSIIEIGDEAFKGCASLNNATYDGTSEDWDRIKGIELNPELCSVISLRHTHNYCEEILRQPDCENDGRLKKTCTICGAEKIETIQALGHTVVHNAEIKATCTEDGKSAGTHCSDCGRVLSGNELIPAKNHSYKDHICSECGYPENEGRQFRVQLDEKYLTNGAILLRDDRSANLSVMFGNDEIPSEYFSFEVLSGSDLADVDDNGKVTANNTAGTVQIQTSLKNGRWKSGPVSITIRKPAPELLVYESGASEHTKTIYIAPGQAKTIQTKYEDKAATCNFEIVPKNKGISITSSGSTATITASDEAVGAFTVTAKRLSIKTVFQVVILDTKPKLSSDEIYLDSIMKGIAVVQLTPQGGNSIHSVKFLDKEYNTESSGDIVASYDIDSSELTLTATKGLQDNTTIKATLSVMTDNGEERIDVTVKVQNAKLSATALQKDDFNCADTSAVTDINLSAVLNKYSQEITGAYLSDEYGRLKGVFDSETGVMKVSLMNVSDPIPNNKNYSINITFKIKGYANEITKSINLRVKDGNNKNSINAQSSGNAFVNPVKTGKLSLAFAGKDSNSGSGSVFNLTEGGIIALKLYSGKEEFDISDCEVKGDKSQNWVDVSSDKNSNTILLTMGENPKGGRVKIFVKAANWTDWAETSYDIKLSSKLTAKLGAKKLSLSSVLGNAAASATLTSDMCNLTIDRISYRYSGNAKLGAEAQKIGFEYSSGKLTAYIKNPSDCPKNGNYSFSITPETAEGQKFTAVMVSVAVAENLPAVKLSNTSLSLSTVFKAKKAYTDISLASSAVDINGINITGIPAVAPAGSAKTAAEAEKIKFSYNSNTGRLTASLDPDNLPKSGTYNFALRADVTDTANKASLKEVKFKVAVVTTIPKITAAKANVTMNTLLTGKETVEIPVMISAAGYSLAGFAESLEDLQYDCSDAVGLSLYGNTLKAVLKNSAAKKTYVIQLTPVLMDTSTGETVTMGSKLSLTFKTAALTPSVSLKTSGSIDKVRPDSAVQAAATFKNISGTPAAVVISGQNSQCFAAELTKDAKGNPAVCIRCTDATIKTGTYKLTFIFTINGTDVSSVASVKVTQGTVKFNKVEERKMYPNQSRSETLKYSISVNSPEDAEIESIALGSINAKLKAAIDSAGGSISWSIDGGKAQIVFAPGDASRYTLGSYEIPLLVTPAGGKPVMVKLKLTVAS